MSILLQLQVDITDDLIYPTHNIDFEYLSITFILDKLRRLYIIYIYIYKNNYLYSNIDVSQISLKNGINPA